jgi:microcystin-dependent protein
MSDPFVAEIRMFGGNFAPTGWAQCNGQLLPISQNTALFSLVGTFYGGDGRSTFALPDLQGRAPMHQGNGTGLSQRFVGEESGVEFVTLLQTEMPLHTHSAMGSSTLSNQQSPVQNFWGGSTQNRHFAAFAAGNVVQMNPLELGVTGGSLPHNNLQPYLVVTFIIAMQGVFPPRS